MYIYIYILDIDMYNITEDIPYINGLQYFDPNTQAVVTSFPFNLSQCSRIGLHPARCWSWRKCNNDHIQYTYPQLLGGGGLLLCRP